MKEASVRDELAIRELVSRYCDAVARRDEKDWAATWTEDGEWHLMGRATKGRNEVVALWSKLVAGFPVVVQIANGGMVQIDGDRATGRWYITEYLLGGEAGALFNLGVYHDQYSRVGDEWLFSRRRFDILYSGPPDLSGMPIPFPANLDQEG